MMELEYNLMTDPFFKDIINFYIGHHRWPFLWEGASVFIENSYVYHKI